jgi:putative chitinase
MTQAKILTNRYKTLLNKNGINTPLRLAAFWGQLYHESKLLPRQENLNYSAKRLLEIFKSDFDTNRDKWLSPKEKEKVRELIGHPNRIANFVYANQGGNGNEASGDGWRYRGRGAIQITLKDNYRQLSKDTGIDFLNNPDLLLEEANSLIAAIWFWNKHKLNYYSDRQDYKNMTKIINGGFNGLEDRIKHINYYKTTFK